MIKKNCGWVHKDRTNFGGVILLTREPDDDTGVTIYKSKNGGYAITQEEEKIKNMHFFGNPIDDDEYNKAYNTYHDQFEEELVEPDAEHSTELGEVPQEETKGSIFPGMAPYGLYYEYR